MPVQITIRNVPEEVRDELAARAARKRLSMQQYLHAELERIASKPTVDEWLEEVRQLRKTSRTRVSTAQILQAKDADRK
jgi:plasmid stability protein